MWSEIKWLLVKNEKQVCPYVCLYVRILIAINFNKYYLMKMQAINIEIDNPYAYCFLFLLSEATYCAADTVILRFTSPLLTYFRFTSSNFLFLTNFNLRRHATYITFFGNQLRRKSGDYSIVIYSINKALICLNLSCH